MCGSAKQPTPQAPPAPIPVRDTQIEARGNRQSDARRAAGSGYESTILTGGGLASSPATTASPVLGG